MEGFSETDLVQFVDWTLAKGLIKEATGRSRKVAVQKVLAALDKDEKNDLRAIDREEAFQRFVNKFAKEFSPDSLTTYKSRFLVTLDDFLRYKENPAGFKPGGAQRAVRAQKEEGSSAGGGEVKKRSSFPAPTIPPHVGEANSMPIPVFIRADVVVRIYGIPHDLTKAEAEKIAAVVGVMAQKS